VAKSRMERVEVQEIEREDTAFFCSAASLF
jgi:hypothetical protein